MTLPTEEMPISSKTTTKIPKIIDPMQTKNHYSYNLYNSYTLTHQHKQHTNTTHQHTKITKWLHIFKLDYLLTNNVDTRDPIGSKNKNESVIL